MPFLTGTSKTQYGAKFKNKIMWVGQYLLFYEVVVMEIWKRIIQHSHCC
jgi:hypothetical protein